MRKISRHMPPLQVTDGWYFVTAAIAAAVFFVYQFPWLLILAAVLTPFAVVSTRRARKQFMDLYESRRGESICTFAREFNCREVDPWIIRAVYEGLQSHCREDDLVIPLRGSDRIEEDLGIDAEDFEYEVMFIAERCGRSLDNGMENKYYEDVTTVRGLVLFLNEQPKVKPAGRGRLTSQLDAGGQA